MLIQGSTIKTLTFDHVVVGFVIPPGVSFQQLFSHGDEVDVIGCCRIPTPERIDSIAVTKAASITNFPLWSVAEPKENDGVGGNPPNGDPTDDFHSQHPYVPGSDEDDAFSFGDAMLVDECLVESTADRPNNDVVVNQNGLPGQSMERYVKDATVLASAPFVHSDPCGPSVIIESDGKGSTEIPAVCTVSKTVPKHVEDEDGNANHSPADKGLRLTDSGKLRDQP